METFYRIVKIQQLDYTSLIPTIPDDIAEKMELFKGQYVKIYLEQIRNLPENKREDGVTRSIHSIIWGNIKEFV
jgi:hypothetical protein